VRIIAATAPGGAIDILARLMGQWFSERLGQPFIIENRPGAGGNIGTEAALRAPADGYTLLLVAPAHMINATLYDKLNFNFVRDAEPLAAIMREPNIMEVHPSLPVKTLPEFIAYAKANPGRINVGSPGNGTSGHIAAEMFKMMAGIDLLHVPFRGGPPSMTALLGGQVQILFYGQAASLEHVKAGTVRGLAVTTSMRSEALPDLPTVAEFLPGYEASALYGMAAPKNTSPGIVERLNREINAALRDPKMKAHLAELGGTVLPSSPAEYGKIIAAEIDKWGNAIRAAHIRAD
jgi:tripartite-type tricarboxylate transporter receptor subunit TctC